MGAMRDDEVSQNAAAVHRRDAAGIVRLVVVGAVVLALILVGFDNRDDVRIGYVIGDAHAAVWIVVVGAS